jgi:hypothetical protein
MTAPRVVVRGFVAGSLAVLVFHQGALLALHLAGLAGSPKGGMHLALVEL